MSRKSADLDQIQIIVLSCVSTTVEFSLQYRLKKIYYIQPYLCKLDNTDYSFFQILSENFLSLGLGLTQIVNWFHEIFSFQAFGGVS